MNCLWTSVLLEILSIVTALPPDTYSESSLVDVVEVDLEKRDEDHRKFHVNLFGKDVELKLTRDKDFSPDQLMAHFLDVDENGNRVVEDYTHRTGGLKDLFYDNENKASILLNELDGRTKLQGNILGEFVIEPEDDDDDNEVSSTVKHRVFRPNITHPLEPADDFIPQDFTTSDFMNVFKEKRQIPGTIYPNIHALVDYQLYKKLGVGESKTLDYIRILYHTAQVTHFSTMTNPRCQISLQGITVCKSNAACSQLNYGKWSYNSYKAADNFDVVGRFAYYERARTGSDYDMMVLTTPNTICKKAGSQECILGFGHQPSMCAKFDDVTKITRRACITRDLGAYDSVRGIVHEMGHTLNMPHDGDNKYQYATTCKSGDYMMSPTMNRKKFSGTFSPCSMYYLHVFLYKPESACIKTRHASNQIEGVNSAYLAGAYMSLNDQCKAVFGDGYRSCHQGADICRNALACNRGGPGAGGCRYHYRFPADGTSCGANLWCEKGRCVTRRI